MQTRDMEISEVLTLLDEKSYLRNTLFKLFAINSIEGMKFYYHMGEKSRTPVFGRFYARLMSTYYKYVHTSAIKLPLQDVEAFIRKSSHLSVGPCPCRVIFDKEGCTAPIYTCIRVNYFSETISGLQDMVNRERVKKGRKPKETGKVLTRNEAVALVRQAYRENGLVLSLESCVQPYQNNICACCPDCCIELNLRYKFGLDVCRSGPYYPVFSPEVCTGCGQCAERCPVNALALEDGRPVLDLDTCLGCGQCTEACGTEAVSLKVDPARIPRYDRPGIFKKAVIVVLTAFMYLLFLRFRAGHENENYKYGKARPRSTDLIRPGES